MLPLSVRLMRIILHEHNGSKSGLWCAQIFPIDFTELIASETRAKQPFKVAWRMQSSDRKVYPGKSSEAETEQL